MRPLFLVLNLLICIQRIMIVVNGDGFSCFLVCIRGDFLNLNEFTDVTINISFINCQESRFRNPSESCNKT